MLYRVCALVSGDCVNLPVIPVLDCYPNQKPLLMLFRWLTNRRRRRLLAQPFPQEWESILNVNVRHFLLLNNDERTKLRNLVRVFVAEKNWEGCLGLRLTDEIRVTIAAQACLLLLGFDDEYFDHVLSILVYPTAYVAPDKTITKGGIEIEERSNRMGEAWFQGPVILSWIDAAAAGRGEAKGHNVVMHEFAHQLDMLNGQSIDGTPPLSSTAQYDRWQEVVHREYDRLVNDCRYRRWTVLDCYGSSDIGEFFAVATESFFEQPDELEEERPDLYAVLQAFYRQDPARR
ncbi:MAG: zinc-dependent peptidase [Planctomycetaceae bacterium]